MSKIDEYKKALKHAETLKDGAVSDLKERQKELKKQLKEVETEIAELTGESSEGGSSSTFFRKTEGQEMLTNTILDVVKDAGKDGISMSGIQQSTKLVELYKSKGINKVPPQFQKLTKLVDKDKKLIKKDGKYFSK